MARKTAQTFVINAQQFQALQELRSWGELENTVRDRKAKSGDRWKARFQIPWQRRTVREAGRTLSGLGGVQSGRSGGTLNVSGVRSARRRATGQLSGESGASPESGVPVRSRAESNALAKFIAEGGDPSTVVGFDPAK